VHAAVQAANKIVGKPYATAAAHARVEDSGYDCSGTISYALGKPGANLLEDGSRSTPRASCAGARPVRASGSPSTRTLVTLSS
jgi:cell wall-associated NlpC family hydrolase